MTTTISKLIITQYTFEERKLCREWCEWAAAQGGSFLITQSSSGGHWWLEYVINWPRNVEPPRGAV